MPDVPENRLRLLSRLRAECWAPAGCRMPRKIEQDGLRVTFERPWSAHMMAIDGTWRRECTVREISERGARLFVETSVQGLALSEFFLLLSSTGLAYRRCQLERVNGPELEVGFLRQKKTKKSDKERD